MTKLRELTNVDLVRQHERLQMAQGLLSQVDDDLRHTDVEGIGSFLQGMANEVHAIGYALLNRQPIEGICRLCGCTTEAACEDGCSWVDDLQTLCSSHEQAA